MWRLPTCSPDRALLLWAVMGWAAAAQAQQVEAGLDGGQQARRLAAGDGARAEAVQGKTERRSLAVQGGERTYRLYLPHSEQGAAPLPLVISLHGAGASGAIQQVLCGFDALADEHRFVVAYPDGVSSVWRFWEPPAGNEGRLARRRAPDDVAFIAALIDALVEEGLVDRRRVYLNGMSNGAFMTHRLACELGDRLAAVAAVAGTMPRIAAEAQRPPRPIPVLYIHGTDDKIVRIDGVDAFSRRGLSLSAADLVAWWAKHNRCTRPPTAEDLPDTEQDGTRVRRHTYQPDEEGAPVLYYEILGGGHTWPGGNLQPRFLLGRTCRDINASKLMWQFFSQYELPEQAATAAGEP